MNFKKYLSSIIKNIFINLIVFSVFILNQANAQHGFAKWTKDELILNNGLVQRVISLPNTSSGKIGTTLYKPIAGNFNYFEKYSPEFQFEIDGKVYSGEESWQLVNIQTITDAKQGEGVAVKIISQDQQFELTIKYLLYPHLPVIRKNLLIKNLSEKTVRVESVDIEKFKVPNYYATTYSWICHDYGRRRSIGPYDGNMQDALLTIHNSDWQQGLVIGNEASGIIKHTSAFWQEPSICSGLTHKDARYPFRKYLQKDESFETPQVFTIVYNQQKDPDEVLNTSVADFTRKHLGIRLFELAQKPTFVYSLKTIAPNIPQNKTRCWYFFGILKAENITAITNILSTLSDNSIK